MTEHAPQGSSDTKDTPAGSGIGNIPPKVRKYGVIAALGLVAVGVMMSWHGISCSSADARETVGNLARERNALQAYIMFNGNGSDVPQKVAVESKPEFKALIAKRAQLEQDISTKIEQCSQLPLKPIPANAPFNTGIIDPVSKEEFINAVIYSDDDMDFLLGLRKDMCRSGTAIGNYSLAMQLSPHRDYYRSVISRMNADLEDTKRRAVAFSEGNENSFSQDFDRAWTAAVEKMEYSLANIITTATDKDTGSVSCKADLVGEVPDWGKATQQITYTVEKTTDGDLYATVWGL